MLDPASRRTVRPAVVTTAALTAAAPAAAPQLSLVVASSRVTSRVVAESRVLVAHQWLHDGWHCGRSECAAQGTCDVLVQRRVVLAQHRGAPGICWTAQIGSQAATTTITTAAPPAASFFLRSSNGWSPGAAALTPPMHRLYSPNLPQTSLTSLAPPTAPPCSSPLPSPYSLRSPLPILPSSQVKPSLKSQANTLGGQTLTEPLHREES